MKISVVMGTRPEAVKLAPVIRALRCQPGFQCNVCVTAQHREMLDQVLSVFDVVPDVDLNLMKAGQTLSELTSRALIAVDQYLERERPALVVCQGDTTTVLACALAAFYRGIPIAHVEAGLRTWNMHAPWPEEANRVLTSRIATLHFAPTETSRNNLLAEGIPAGRILVTGNTVIDALHIAVNKVRCKPPSITGLDSSLLQEAEQGKIVLITGHRRESLGEKLENICCAIGELAHRFPEVHFVYPVHLNPAVRESVRKILDPDGVQPFRNVHLIPPLPYFEFVALLDKAKLIVTDSGGIQEEAPSLGKPVLVTRETTERPEGLNLNCSKLVGADRVKIVSEVSRLLTDDSYYQALVPQANPYGDGTAAIRIVEAIRDAEPLIKVPGLFTIPRLGQPTTPAVV